MTLRWTDDDWKLIELGFKALKGYDTEASIYREDFPWLSDEEWEKRQEWFEQPIAKCEHEWVNVGFTSEKLVCKKCDKEKEC